MAQMTVDGVNEGELDVTVPAVTVKNIAKVIPGDVTFTFGEKRLIVQNDHTVMAVTLLEGTFPALEKVYDPNPPIVVKTDRTALLNAAERASLFRMDGSSVGKLSFNSDTLTLDGQSPEVGTFHEEIPCEVTGYNSDDPYTISLNIEYVVTALKGAKGDDIELKFAESNSRPFLVSGSEDTDSLIQVLLGVRAHD